MPPGSRDDLRSILFDSLDDEANGRPEPGFHLTYDLFLLVLRGEMPAELVDGRSRLHLIELCDTCEREWRASTDPAREVVQRSPGPVPDADPPAAPEGRDHLSLGDLAAAEKRLARLRKAARLARVDLSRLLRLPQAEWARRIDNARTRFRSRAFVLLLIEEARQRVETAPRQAADLAALVPRVVTLRREWSRQSWVQDLLAEAEALESSARAMADPPVDGG